MRIQLNSPIKKFHCKNCGVLKKPRVFRAHYFDGFCRLRCREHYLSMPKKLKKNQSTNQLSLFMPSTV